MDGSEFLEKCPRVVVCAAKTSSLPDRRDHRTTEFENQIHSCQDKKKKKKKKHVEKTEEENRN